MTKEKALISHPGIIQEIDQDTLKVMVLAKSACASCHAKTMCNIADMKEKVIEVKKKAGRDYKLNDEVNVYMEKSLGNRAVLYAYFFPFLVLLTTLIILLEVTKNEAISGIIALLTLVPYYFILYLLKDKLSKTYIFKVY